MNNNIKIRTALKFLLKKIFTFSVLTKIFANYPRIAKLIKYLSNTLLLISTLNLILKYVFSINLDLLERLGIVIFLSQLLGKFSAYYKTIADYLKETVEVTTPDLPKPVKTEVSKVNTPDWDFEFFKKRKEFYEKLEAVKNSLSEGKTISKEDVNNILNSGLTISEDDRALLNNQLKTSKGWFSYFTDHPYITAAVIMTGAGIAIYLGGGGSADDAKSAIVGVFSSFVSYVTSHTKTAEVPLNNTETKNVSDIEINDGRTDQTDGLDNTRSEMDERLKELLEMHNDKSAELLRLQKRLNEPMTSENAGMLNHRIQDILTSLEGYDSAKNDIIARAQIMFEEKSSKASKSYLETVTQYIEVSWKKIDFNLYREDLAKTSVPPVMIPEVDDMEMWSNHSDDLRSNASGSTRSNSPAPVVEELTPTSSRSNSPVVEDSKESTPTSSRSQTPEVPATPKQSNTPKVTVLELPEDKSSGNTSDKPLTTDPNDKIPSSNTSDLPNIEEELNHYFSKTSKVDNPLIFPDNKDQFTIAHYLSNTEYKKELMDWLKTNNERGVFTEYMMTEIETSKSFDNNTLDEVLAYFSKPEFEFTREIAFPHLKPLSDEDLDEIENQNKSPISTPTPSPVDEISDPFSGLSTSIFKPNLDSDSDSENIDIDSDDKKLRILKSNLEHCSYQELMGYRAENLYYYYIQLNDANLEIPANLINVLKEKGFDLSFLSFFVSYLKNLKNEDTPKHYIIKIPARTTIITADEVSARDFEDLQLLATMDRYEVLLKVSYQELLYFEQLFEVFEEEVPSEMQIVLDYYDLKYNNSLPN